MIEVSIICNTYNHEHYIREAIESFLNQKTTFEYEILIHDDASTDNTAEIIKEYERAYPDIIKPIYQVENQYSRGVSIGSTFQIPRAQGKYLALCEGDDYWIDSYKLQKQHDALEKMQNINICSCGTDIFLNGKRVGEMAPANSTCVFTPDQVILGGGGFVGTNSIMLRKKEYLENAFALGHDLDYFVQIAGSVPNGMIYLCDHMAAYRMMAVDSWTVKMNNDSAHKIRHLENVAALLKEYDVKTEGLYSNAIQQRIKKIEFDLLLGQKNFRRIHEKEYEQIYKALCVKEKIKIQLKEIMHVITKK